MKIDVIGDIHGCYDELCSLLDVLGYKSVDGSYAHPDQRIIIFLGDITDRGPASMRVIELVYQLVVDDKMAKYVPGNHCNKLFRYFSGNNVMQQHGLETTVAEYLTLSKPKQKIIKHQFTTLYKKAPLYLELPEVNAIVAHAGMKESFLGRKDNEVKSFVLYGDVTGELDKLGRPIRKDWAKEYDGDQWIIYGHTPVLQPRKVNKAINIDTGCVFGNALTAFRLPEAKTVSVPSLQSFLKDKFRHFK